MKETFERKLKRILEEKQKSLIKIHEELEDKNVIVTYASLYSYLTGKSIPPQQKAEQILSALGYNTEKEELTNVIEVSKNVHAERRKKETVLHLNLKIKPEMITKEFQNDPEKAKKIIDKRASEFFGEKPESLKKKKKRKLSAYIAMLIKEDLEENSYLERQD